MKILVTGPDGVLGSNLIRELLSREYNVSVLLEDGKDPITLKGLDINRFYGNILDPVTVEAAVEEKDVVFHCAAATSLFPARNEMVNRVNIEGTQNIISASQKFNIKRLIYVGTANSFSFGSSKNALGVEGTEYISGKYGLDYMDSKFKAQQLVLECVKNEGLPAIVVNPTFMIGPFDSRPSSGAMTLAIHNGKVPGFTDGGKNYIAVKDVAFAMANAIEMGRIGECYILGNQNLTYKEAFELIAETVGVKAPKRKLSNSIVKSYGNVSSLLGKTFGYYPTVTRELARISTEKHYYSAEKAQRELNLPQTSLKVAVQDSIDWFRDNGYLNK